MPDTKLTVHIVPSSHWDREWYLPQRRYQFRLVKLMDKVIELLQREDYPTFLLDGQTIMLEDYLEIRPHARKELERLVSEGRLIVGPWYVIPDLFIPSGEALIKNLEIGKKISEEFGRYHPIGYTPDSFGFSSQVPQLMSGFGIKGILFCRGLRTEDGSSGKEFVWKSPDGTSMPALYEGYTSGLDLSYPEIWRNLDKYPAVPEKAAENTKAKLERHKNGYLSGNLLMIVGVDHIQPRDSLPVVIEALKEGIPGVEFIHSSLEDYFDAMIKESGNYPVINGEQRGQWNKSYGISNVLSSRMDIKLMNRQAEDLLQWYCEPLALWAAKTGNGAEAGSGSFDTSGIREQAWKLLIQNHAHDSICTCGVDDSNKDIETRLRQAGQMARDVMDCHLSELGSSVKIDTSVYRDDCAAVMVYNPLASQRTGMVEGIIRIPLELKGTVFVVYDNMGKEVPGASVEVLIIKRHDLETMKMSDTQVMLDETRTPMGDYKPYDMFTFLKVEWIAENMPAMGYRCYVIAPAGADGSTAGLKNRAADLKDNAADLKDNTVDQNKNGTNPISNTANLANRVVSSKNSLENSFYKVKVNCNGSLDILNKKTGEWFRKLHQIEDEADIGDEYNFSYLKGDKPLSTEEFIADIGLVEASDLKGTLRISWDMKLPAGQVGRSARTEETCIVPLVTEISLSAGSDHIEFRTRIGNSVKDHRMRAIFNVPHNIMRTISDTAFDLVERPVFDRSEIDEYARLTNPMRDLLHIPGAGEKGDMLILSRSSHEYEAIRENGHTEVAMTLFRSVGRVMNLKNSPFGTGTRWWTEDAQLQKEMEFEYALVLGDGTVRHGEAYTEAQSYAIPLKPVAITPMGKMPSEYSFMEIKPGNLVLSSVYALGDNGRGSAVRFFNPANEGCEAVLQWKGSISEAYELNLAGDRLRRLEVSDEHSVRCLAAGKKIVTVEIVD